MPPAPCLSREPFSPALWVLAHTPKPQAHWLLLVQWGLEAGLGRSLWIIPYVFPFGVYAGERCGGGFVLLLGVVFFFGEEYLTGFGFLNETLRRVGLVYGSAKYRHPGG